MSSFGTFTAVNATTPRVSSAPIQTERTVPSRVAATPLSKAPNSFDEPMKTVLTAATRPRIASGANSRVMARRTTTLMPSHMPATTSIANERMKLSDSAKAIMAQPKPAMAICRSRPV